MEEASMVFEGSVCDRVQRLRLPVYSLHDRRYELPFQTIGSVAVEYNIHHPT